MPPSARVGDSPKLYTFSAFYTPEYFKKSLVHIYNELMCRSDIKEEWKTELDKMRDYFNNRLSNIIPDKLLVEHKSS